MSILTASVASGSEFPTTRMHFSPTLLGLLLLTLAGARRIAHMCRINRLIGIVRYWQQAWLPQWLAMPSADRRPASSANL